MLVKVATCPFIGHDVLIDPFMTDMNTVLGFQPHRYLFRAPILVNQLLNPLPSIRRYPRLGLVAPSERHAVGLFGAQSPLTTIAPQFLTNGRYMDADGISYLGLVVTNFLKGINLVSLCLGKLLIGCHSCSFDLVS